MAGFGFGVGTRQVFATAAMPLRCSIVSFYSQAHSSLGHPSHCGHVGASLPILFCVSWRGTLDPSLLLPNHFLKFEASRAIGCSCGAVPARRRHAARSQTTYCHFGALRAILGILEFSTKAVALSKLRHPALLVINFASFAIWWFCCFATS